MDPRFIRRLRKIVGKEHVRSGPADLEVYSYDVMRQPISTPRMTRMVIRYLKDDVIIKAQEEKLKTHIKDLDALAHPFSLLKNDTNDGYMICNSNSCFGHEKDFSGVIEVLEKR